MPISKYFKGKGEEVMEGMEKTYGAEKGKKVFYATANKKGMKPKGKAKAKKKGKPSSLKAQMMAFK